MYEVSKLRAYRYNLLSIAACAGIWHWCGGCKQALSVLGVDEGRRMSVAGRYNSWLKALAAVFVIEEEEPGHLSTFIA